MVVLPEQIDASPRVRAVSDKVPQLPDLVEASIPAGIADHTLCKASRFEWMSETIKARKSPA